MNLGQLILVSAIRIYRWILSPAKVVLFGPLGRCRFTPSCSAYALEAVQTHGALDGSWLAFRRVCHCHPWGGCGPDPVPPIHPPVASSLLARTARTQTVTVAPGARWGANPGPHQAEFRPENG